MAFFFFTSPSLHHGRPGAPNRPLNRARAHKSGLTLTVPGVYFRKWLVLERGRYLTLVSQVRIALPRSSSYRKGRIVGHFHTRP